MSTIPAQFTAGSLAPDFKPENYQELFDEFARLLAGNVTVSGGTYINGGAEPGSDQGPWLPAGLTELRFWDAAFGRYFPGGLPAGTFIWSGTDPGLANNWVECNGDAVAQSTYPRLFAAIGQTFAKTTADATALAGAGQFRLPDMAGRFPLGAGTERLEVDRENNRSARTLGTGGGSEYERMEQAMLPQILAEGWEYDATPPTSYTRALLMLSTKYDLVAQPTGYSIDLARPMSTDGSPAQTDVQIMPPFLVLRCFVRF